MLSHRTGRATRQFDALEALVPAASDYFVGPTIPARRLGLYMGLEKLARSPP